MKIFRTFETNVKTNSEEDDRTTNLDEPNAEQDIQRRGRTKSVRPGQSNRLSVSLIDDDDDDE
jgi:hypothetical protein